MSCAFRLSILRGRATVDMPKHVLLDCYRSAIRRVPTISISLGCYGTLNLLSYLFMGSFIMALAYSCLIEELGENIWWRENRV